MESEAGEDAFRVIWLIQPLAEKNSDLFLKEADFEDDFWADHDEDCHGDIDDLVDDPDVQDGFKWSCCGELGDAEGCKWTKHKSDINVIVRKPVHIPASKSRPKRKAEVDVKEPKKKRRT